MLKATLCGRQVSVIEDQEKVVYDSFAIVRYLERTYPHQPSLFGGPGGKALQVALWPLACVLSACFSCVTAVAWR